MDGYEGGKWCDRGKVEDGLYRGVENGGLGIEGTNAWTWARGKGREEWKMTRK